MKGGRSAPRYINKLSNKIRREFDAHPVVRDISPAEGRLLYFLVDTPGPIYQRDIEEEYSLRPPSASAILKKMEADGLITRKSVKGDGRLKSIEITEKGLTYKDLVRDKIRQMEDVVTKDISKEDMEVFYRVVEQMLENMP